jgi:hypothetical protein
MPAAIDHGNASFSNYENEKIKNFECFYSKIGGQFKKYDGVGGAFYLKRPLGGALL